MRFLIPLSIFVLSVNVAANEISIKNISLVPSTSYEKLIDEGFKPRKDIESWPFAIPIDWNADPFRDTNWRFQLHAWRLIDPILIKYKETNNIVFLQEAITIIMDWYKYHIVNEKKSDMQWYDMSTGLRAMKLAWIWNELALNESITTIATMEKLHHLMELHVDKLMNESLLAEGNHAYFQLVGLRLSCLANNTLSACENEPIYNKQKMKELLSKQFTEQGINRENSTYYHIFTTKILKRLNIAHLYGEEISELVNKAELVIPWLVYPDGTIARIGDSAGKENRRLPVNTKVHVIGDTTVMIGNFMQSGYITVRTTQDTPLKASTQLFITGTSNKDYLAHKHADELSFELFHNGELVIIDPGKYSYSTNAYRNYVVSARAHNTLSLENIEIWPGNVTGSDSKIISFSTNEKEIVIRGEIDRPNLFKHQREFILYPFHKIIIKDTFEDDVPWLSKIKSFNFKTIVTSNLHINPKLKVTKISEDIVRINNFVDIELLSKDCDLQIIHGQVTPLLGWVSFSYNEITPASVVQARCPIVSSGELTWNISLR